MFVISYTGVINKDNKIMSVIPSMLAIVIGYFFIGIIITFIYSLFDKEIDGFQCTVFWLPVVICGIIGLLLRLLIVLFNILGIKHKSLDSIMNNDYVNPYGPNSRIRH